MGRAPGRTTNPDVPSPERVAGLLTKIHQRLERRYGSPRLGNPRNPLDDLIFLLLSARTRGVVHEPTYQRLKRAFPSCKGALQAGPRAISEVIADAGLGEKKARQIHEILVRLARRFGRPTLAPVRRMSDAEAEEFLTSLPGVGLKTTRCVLMYCFQRQLFPVDAHVLRLFGYFGMVNPDVRQEFAQDPLQSLVPPAIRYSLHVNMVAHGRETCLPNHPRCESCVVEDLCPASRLKRMVPLRPPYVSQVAEEPARYEASSQPPDRKGSRTSPNS